MNELISITRNENGQQAVSARELHDFLEVKTPFKQWIDRMIQTYDFEENTDFVLVTQKCATNNPSEQNVHPLQ